MTESKKPKSRPVQCACMKDGFAALPPELRPRSKKKSSLRRVTCPGCGLVYRTNRATDLCMECEKKGLKAP
jgi:hypothetical protein